LLLYQKCDTMHLVPLTEVTSMYGQGGGQPNPVLPIALPVGGVAGITMLPNTGAGVIFVVLSYLAIGVGLAILASTVARMVAAKRFN